MTGRHRHGVFLRESYSKEPETRTSLQELLGRFKNRGPGYKLRWEDLLAIAAILASTVLQLEGTGWLKSRWSSSDLELPVSAGPNPGKVDFGHPAVSLEVGEEIMDPVTISSGVRVSTSHGIRCEALFALGVILVELSFAHHLTSTSLAAVDAWKDPDVSQACQDLMYARYGESYGDVVRRCLECDLDIREKSLDSEQFRREVLQKIVLPLHEDHKACVVVSESDDEA
ncbi:MAG: hypothetical protein Q9170_007098 [Blastenia crenularia]